MDKEKMMQAFIDIREAMGIMEATIKTLCEDACINDRLEWVLIGLIDQIKKVRKAAGAIDEVMSAREDCTA